MRNLVVRYSVLHIRLHDQGDKRNEDLSVQRFIAVRSRSLEIKLVLQIIKALLDHIAAAVHLKYLCRCFIEVRLRYNEEPAHRNNFKATLVSEKYILIYIPNGLGFDLVPEKVAAYPRATLFNPRTGDYRAFDGIDENLRVRLPSKGRGEDWVLILEK